MEEATPMEHRATPTGSLLASATEDELIVAKILLDLRPLMSLSESLSNFNWGRRRRRSYVEPPPQPAATLIAAPSRPAASPENRIDERSARTNAEDAAVQDKKHGGGACNTASPNTPLSFSPSEPDMKPKHSSKKSSKKGSKEKYLHMLGGLIQDNELLRGEIEKVKKYYSKLKVCNSKFKAAKQQVLNSRINLGMESMQHNRIPCEPHHQPDPIAAHLQPSDDMGPLGIDLNLPAEEAFGVEPYRPLDVMIDDKRARFAEARRKRMGLMKSKSSRNS